MAITYPLDLPTNVGQTKISLGGMYAVSKSSSPFTFQSQTQIYDGELWTLEVSLPLMRRAEAEVWITFLMKLKGSTGTFLAGDTYATSLLGRGTGNPKVNGDNQKGLDSMYTQGWTPNGYQLLKAGDYFQVGSRLYKVLTDVNSDSSGYANIDIFPRIKDIHYNNDLLILSNPKGLFRLNTNSINFFEVTGHVESPVYSLSFSAIESF